MQLIKAVHKSLHYLSFPTAYGLKCYVGLGNTSELKKQKVVECPEEKHYVCMKMYGGGMGDQVRRKCHLINSVSYSFKSHPMYVMCMYVESETQF